MIVLQRGSHQRTIVRNAREYRQKVESKRCPECHGNEYVRERSFGSPVYVSCPKCGGTGRGS